MRIMNSTGERKGVMVPMIIDAPDNIAAMPRYMGWRVARKGPSVSSDVGVSCGFTVVLVFLNTESAQRFSIMPKIIRRIPEYAYGGFIIFVIG